MLEKGPQVPSLLIYPLYMEKEKKKRAGSKKFKFFTSENFLYLISEIFRHPYSKKVMFIG